MTNIDALIAALRGRHVEELTSLGRDPDKYCSVLSSAADALTTEREKVAKLEAEAARWREVAGELSGALEKIAGTSIPECDCEKCLRVRAALTAHTAAPEIGK